MSSKETLTVAPTRMNLLDLRNRKKLAENGYNLLKEKRDALIIELYNLVDQIKGGRGIIVSRIRQGFDSDPTRI